MGQTPVHSLPYPELSDPADVPADIKELAEAVDAIIPSVPVIPPGGGGFTNFPILDVGMSGQNRAGRQLVVADFTSLGLAAPLGLWNLSDLADASGNARTLVNKGAVPFGTGINGQATTAAVFAGSTAQALYFDDQGTNDPLRIKTGSFGCWVRTAKRGVAQGLVTKHALANQFVFSLTVAAGNTASVEVSTSGVAITESAVGVSDVADDRWHFVVATYDGHVKLYVDGALEASNTGGQGDSLFPGASPFNIGAYAASAAVAAGIPCYGRVDEAFVTADVLTEDQVRCLYCAKLAHALGAIPGDVRIAIHRLRKGASLVTTDFPSAPIRLHNFTAGALTDAGSGNVALTAAGAAPVVVAGADGTAGNAYSFATGGRFNSTDAGLPSGTAARSYGCWFKGTTIPAGAAMILNWGTTLATNDVRIWVASGGQVCLSSGADQITGPFVCDGQWHFVAGIEDNAAGDGVKRKLYLDGRLVGGSTVLNSITLGGANKFVIGADVSGTNAFVGQIDGAFVHGSALTAAEVAKLYAKGAQDLAASTKNAGDHVERVDGNSLLVTFDTLPTQHTVDLGVAA